MKLKRIIPVFLLVLQVVELLSRTKWWKKGLETVKESVSEQIATVKYKFHLN